MGKLAIEVDPAEVGLDAARLSRVDRLLDRYLDAGRLAGDQMLITRRGSVVHATDAGRRHLEDGLPVEADTLWRIYSMTKPITSVAAMMLYEEGAFELTDPVSRFIPSFADQRVFVGGSDLKPVTVPATEPVRIWHLLTHTAGLTYGFHRTHPVDGMLRARGYEWGAPDGTTMADAVEQWAGLPLLFQPGDPAHAEQHPAAAHPTEAAGPPGAGRLTEPLTPGRASPAGTRAFAACDGANGPWI